MDTPNNTMCFTFGSVADSILITIYTAVLIGGLIGITLMCFFLCRTNTRTITTTVVINLVAVHSIFLLTVPFRIAFYIQKKWHFGLNFCKLVSAMIHIHMYLSFVFYVTTLSIRYLSFFKHRDKIEFYRKLHAVVASGAVWTVVLVVIMPPFFLRYGKNSRSENGSCFHFQGEFENINVKALNYVSITTVLVVVCFLLALQIFIIVKVVKKLQGSAFAHQEFWAQLKSLFFILIMIVCFVPYHMFRIYYIQHTHRYNYYNEIFLSVTAFSCFDLLSFVLYTCCQKG
ncbi:hypothetical protein FKM82_019330 [Ascaphus truei]